MSFGIANNVRSEVRVCTPELLNEALDSPQVARTCAEIEDALEKCRRGELTKDEFETMKGKLKKRLPILTLHATFANGRRKNDDAVPSGLSMYDLDHIPNPREKWAEIESRKEELGILLAHITPSTEGLRLAFVMPQGMSLAEAQAWMASQLGDDKYDACVKDYARSSFVVPREYVLYLDVDALFCSPQSNTESHGVLNCHADGMEAPQSNTESYGVLNNRADEKNKKLCETPCDSVVNKTYPQTYENIPYENIVEVLEEQMGGEPEHGSRNNFIFSMACHLRHVCNDDAIWIAQILPTYGEAKEKWLGSIKSACARNQTKSMPRILKRVLAICKQRQEEETDSDSSSNGMEPPKMPVRLPPLIKLLVSKTPKIYRPAVAHAVFPALATHLWKTTFRYIDNVEHEATLINVSSILYIL